MKNCVFLICLFSIRILFSEIDPGDFLKKNDFRGLSDFVYGGDAEFAPESLFDGAVVYVPTLYMEQFFLKTFKNIQNKFILITYGDKGSPGGYQPYLEHPNIIAWFGVNPTIKSGGKFFGVPIGLFKECPKELYNLDESKEYLLYMNMSVQKGSSNHWKVGERTEVFNLFSNKLFCYSSPVKPFEEYLVDLKKSRFVLSPRGNGYDCYRTWEAIAMGSIPIVRSSPLDFLFADMPVLIVKNWHVVEKKFLKKKEIEIRNKKVNLEKMSLKYWIGKIEEAKKAVSTQKPSIL